VFGWLDDAVFAFEDIAVAGSRRVAAWATNTSNQLHDGNRDQGTDRDQHAQQQAANNKEGDEKSLEQDTECIKQAGHAGSSRRGCGICVRMPVIVQHQDRLHMNESEPGSGESKADMVEGENVICAITDIPENAALGIQIPSATGGFPIVLTRRGDQVQAFHNECPHAGRRLDWVPGQFLIENNLLVCAAHGAAFTRDSGLCLAGPCRGQGLVRFPVIVRDDKVLLAR
jgi:nitrite reductase/ring-hydroxylating ferredoxin subunit